MRTENKKRKQSAVGMSSTFFNSHILSGWLHAAFVKKLLWQTKRATFRVTVHVL